LPWIDVLEEELTAVLDPGAVLEELATGFRSAEGPIWVARGRYLLFSDIRNDARLRWDEGSGIREVASPAHHSIGMTLRADGSLIVCEAATSMLVRMDAAGTGAGREVLASHYGDRELNSPNDVIVGRDGAIWFTDPPGGRTATFGIERPRELAFQGVFRLDPGGALTLVADDFDVPNGLCLSPDESVLYVNDTNRAEIRAFDMGTDGTASRDRVFADGVATGVRADGWLDGMKCDEHGNVWATAPHGVWILDASGRHLGTLRTPEPALNLHWGGDDWSTLFITCLTSLHRIATRTTGRREPFMGVG
jgi:gluconolactonase